MQSFYQKFVQSAERWPGNVALEMQRQGSLERYTYAELRRMAESVGRWLQENGVARGSTCGILAANSPRWTAAYLGILAAGGVAVPFDTAFSRAQVATILRDSGAVCAIVDAAAADQGQRAVECSAQTPQQVEQRQRHVHAGRVRCELQQRTVDIQEQRPGCAAVRQRRRGQRTPGGGRRTRFHLVNLGTLRANQSLAIVPQAARGAKSA